MHAVWSVYYNSECMLALCMLSLLLCVAGGGGAGFWSALLDGHVPHKQLLALFNCVLDSEKQVGVACCRETAGHH